MSTERSPAKAELRMRDKQQAAERAAELVQSGMIVGLGTGSTTIFATRGIGRLLQDGLLKDIVGFATSKAVWEEAVRLGIAMMPEEMPHVINLAIDDADEVDGDLNLIKGAGGALVREKIVAQAETWTTIVARGRSCGCPLEERYGELPARFGGQ